MNLQVQVKKLWALFQKYKLVLLVFAVGLVLLLWPNHSAQTAVPVSSEETEAEFHLNALERKLESVLSQIEGAGQVSVALTLKDGMERVYATDETWSQDGDGQEDQQTQTVILSTGSGTEAAVLVQQRYPTFQGAVVVCSGGGDAEVRLLITQAVSALTGLGTDRISVCKGN